MQFTHKCPKCASYEIVKVEGTNMNQATMIPLTKWSFKQAILDRYICCRCGYTEEYVRRTDKFKKWADKALREKPEDQEDGFV